MANPVDKYDRKVRGGAETLVNLASSSGAAYFGTLNVTCGANGATVLVGTTLAQSGSLVFLGAPRQLGPSSFAAAAMFSVTSIATAVGFHVGPVNSFAMPTSLAVPWELKNPA